jgi:RHS repeat-associated protein
MAYGPDNQRTREWGSDGTKVYLDGGYEDWISAGSTKVYVDSDAEITDAGSTRTVNYMLTDRLGSMDTISDASGNIIETRGSDPFGKPRSGTWADLSPPQLQSTAITEHGFTGHAHLNSVQLIHMNGRVYDYQLGRFLSVDPFIQFPLNSQSLNPYSYIGNNPLSGTDPTGYEVCGADGSGDCTQVKETHEAPTGSHIASNTVYSGKVSDGNTTAHFSVTMDKEGSVLSSSFSVSNGKSSQGISQSVKPEANTASIGVAAVRSNVANGVADTVSGGEGSSIAGRVLGGSAELGEGMVSATGATAAVIVAGVWPTATSSDDGMSPSKALNLSVDSAWHDSLADAAKLRKSGSSSAVIGESMDRVVDAAEKLHASKIDFGQYWFDQRTPARDMIGLVYNAGWMTGVMQNQMHIYDIGLDSRPRERSANYRLERQFIDLARYPNYEQRPWEFGGGWDYQHAK